MRKLYLLVTFLLTITGCFNTDLTPPDNAVGELVGCQTHEGDLFCLTYYALADTPHPPIDTSEEVYFCSIDDIEQVWKPHQWCEGNFLTPCSCSVNIFL